ncbi:hypothetical protein VOLCADRAFT_103311 [Volvox carteri f. nagariensis]|uniref:Uncharacterized protein n=1 Tax=Volvox carteri f. nagariensis TaxID=3068 RepID=D8TL74_VOLCA|nr:uncharacterized protein VOLCADRAFT_103311 [Volvox carteri f. nagariensis]EFJ51689.1 hypothetical protein VOLCADRAFT_103311 [Volvox carteri f. nagariensis]|eukprot:XP_002947099.1 hypothetical protein VOLCADRAFT_103311 [Volvox carteri f. nagariensis]
MASSASTSIAYPRFPLARMGSWRAPARDQRGMSSRTQGAANNVAAASSYQFDTASSPPMIRGLAIRQSSLFTKVCNPYRAAFWSLQSDVPFIVQTHKCLSLAALLSDPIGWLKLLVDKLQSALTFLLIYPQRKAPAQPACDCAPSASSASTTAESSHKISPGFSRLATAPGRQISEACRQALTRLVTTQASNAPVGQRSAAPAVALAVALAAAMAFTSYWLFRRWRTVVENQREHAQRIAVKKDNLARQKQRFQRALVVDSVNLELPPIKQWELSSRNPQQGNTLPGLAGESLRQWQQFMAASRATEVTNISGARGGRGAVEQPAERPYVALDDRMLADLSERIRRANDFNAVGEQLSPIPAITFEQLYANSRESDEAAMARRAAERKARWQKRQPGETASTSVAPPYNKVDFRQSLTNPKPLKKPVCNSLPKIMNSNNPFVVGLFNSSADAATSTAPATIRSSIKPHEASALHGLSLSETVGSAPSEFNPLGSSGTCASTCNGGWATGRNPFVDPPSSVIGTCDTAVVGSCSIHGGPVSCGRPLERTVSEAGALKALEQTTPEPIDSTTSPAAAFVVNAHDCATQLPIRQVFGKAAESCNPSLSMPQNGGVKSPHGQEYDVAVNHSWVSRAPGDAAGIQVQASGRLTCRPMSKSATLEETYQHKTGESTV